MLKNRFVQSSNSRIRQWNENIYQVLTVMDNKWTTQCDEPALVKEMVIIKKNSISEK